MAFQSVCVKARSVFAERSVLRVSVARGSVVRGSVARVFAERSAARVFVVRVFAARVSVARVFVVKGSSRVLPGRTVLSVDSGVLGVLAKWGPVCPVVAARQLPASLQHRQAELLAELLTDQRAKSPAARP